jgi:hypothetical protein
VDSSIVPVEDNGTITFSKRISAIGYGFSDVDTLENPRQGANSGIDADSDGATSFDGFSGLLPRSIIVNNQIKTSMGDYTISYRSQ